METRGKEITFVQKSGKYNMRSRCWGLGVIGMLDHRLNIFYETRKNFGGICSLQCFVFSGTALLK